VKQGDLVRFINENHSSYHRLRDAVGIVLDVDETAKWRRLRLDQYLGAKVTVMFDGQEPRACNEAHLEVISEGR